ncbi:MAG: biotin/lipoyl-containing protein [bacterium]
MKLYAKTACKEYTVELQDTDGELQVLLNGQSHPVQFQQLGPPGLFSLVFANRCYQLFIRKNSACYEVIVDNQKYHVELADERQKQLNRLTKKEAKRAEPKQVKAPMPGLIVKIEVREGQRVKPGDGLVIIEAMKMENEIKATAGGIVKKIFKTDEESVDKDTLLMLIE